MREKYDRLWAIASGRPGSWRQAKKRVDDKPLTWLEREQPAEGFVLELPPPFQLFTLTVDGTRLSVSPTTGGRTSDELWEKLRHKEKDLIEQAGGDAERIRSEKRSVEIEMEPLQSTLDEKCRCARAVMNAWLFLASESLPESQARKRPLRELESDIMQLRSQYRQNRGGYPSKAEVLTSLSEKYSRGQLLRYESIVFWNRLLRPPVIDWNRLAKPRTDEQLRGGFSALSGFFDVDPLIEETTLDGLLFYRQQIAKQIEALLPLELRRIACEIRHTEIVRGMQSLWERQSAEEERKRGIYGGPAKGFWRYAYELYRTPNELKTWRDVFRYMWREQEDLGLPSKRHKDFPSFESARTTFQSQNGDPLA